MIHREQSHLKQIAFSKLWKAMNSWWLSKQSCCRNRRCNHTFNVFEMLKQLRVQLFLLLMSNTTATIQKVKFSIKDFFSKCDQIRRKLRIWSHLLKKSLTENFFFCAVSIVYCVALMKCFSYNYRKKYVFQTSVPDSILYNN